MTSSSLNLAPLRIKLVDMKPSGIVTVKFSRAVLVEVSYLNNLLDNRKD